MSLRNWRFNWRDKVFSGKTTDSRWKAWYLGLSTKLSFHARYWEHVSNRSNWGGVSQEGLLGGGEAHIRLFLKEVMPLNCGGELGGSVFLGWKLAGVLA